MSQSSRFLGCSCDLAPSRTNLSGITSKSKGWEEGITARSGFQGYYRNQNIMNEVSGRVKISWKLGRQRKARKGKLRQVVEKKATPFYDFGWVSLDG